MDPISMRIIYYMRGCYIQPVTPNIFFTLGHLARTYTATPVALSISFFSYVGLSPYLLLASSHQIHIYIYIYIYISHLSSSIYSPILDRRDST